MLQILRTKLWPVSAFTIAYLLFASSFVVSQANWEFLFYIGIVLLFGIVALILHVRVPITIGILWALSIWGLLHMAGGLVPTPEGWPINGTKAVLYSWWIIPNYLKYDHIIHAYGFGIATAVCWQAIKVKLKIKKPTLGVLSLCVFAGMGLGAINEIVEFIAVLTIPDTNVGGYINTGWDLVSNLFGCIVAAVLIRGNYILND